MNKVFVSNAHASSSTSSEHGVVRWVFCGFIVLVLVGPLKRSAHDRDLQILDPCGIDDRTINLATVSGMTGNRTSTTHESDTPVDLVCEVRGDNGRVQLPESTSVIEPSGDVDVALDYQIGVLHAVFAFLWVAIHKRCEYAGERMGGAPVPFRLWRVADED